MPIGRIQARAAIDAIRAGTTRANRREEVAALVNAGNEWLAKRDAQDAATPADFAKSKGAQFNAFVAALPDVVLAADAVP